MSAADMPDDFDASDQRWLDALSMPGPTEGPSWRHEEVQEAWALREAVAQERLQLLGRPDAAALDEPVLREHRLQALLLDLRRQGLLRAEVTGARRRCWAWGVPLGAVSALVALVVAWPLFAPPTAPELNPPPAWRGGQPELVQRAPDPGARARAVQGRLMKAGVWTALYRDGRDYVLDVDVEPAQLDELRPLLSAEGLPIGAGMTRVRFVGG